MPATAKEFIDGITHKKIYYFKSGHIKHSTEPHYFCVAGFDTESVMILSCFTTQIEKKIAYLDSRGLDYCTLVMVEPSQTNGLTAKCCVNCNDVYIHSKEEFERLYLNGNITEKGELEDLYYTQIYTGLTSSTLIEEETKLKLKDIE